MNAEQLHRDLGRVEGEVKALRRDTANVQSTVSDLSKKLDSALAYIERQKGARRATVALSAGAGGVVAAIVGWLVSWYHP